jgi:flagellar basal body rod protein FlgC
MDSAEMTEWVAYAQLDPFGNVRSDLQAGVVASTVANVNRDKKKKKAPYEPHDFVLRFERQAKQQRTPEELLVKVQGLARLFGHKLTTGN